MVDSWEQVRTKTQQGNLVRDTVIALEELVDASETKDLINRLPIAEKADSETDFRKIYLTKKGLEEERTCRGHRNYDAAGGVDYDHCNFENNPHIVPKNEFPIVVVNYKLTPKIISDFYASLRA